MSAERVSNISTYWGLGLLTTCLFLPVDPFHVELKDLKRSKGFNSEQMLESELPTSIFPLKKKTEKESFIFLLCSFFPFSLLLPWWELQVTAGSETCGIYWSAEASRKDGGRIMRLPGQPGIKVDPCLPFLASHFGQVRRNPSLYKIWLSHKSHRQLWNKLSTGLKRSWRWYTVIYLYVF